MAVKKIKRLIRFFTEDIWSKRDSEYHSKWLRITAKQLRVFIYTARSYEENQLVIRAAALTFYTLMALVPLAAIIFGIAKGFMFETRISDYLYNHFPQYSEMIGQVINFANAMLERTKGGVLASIGFITLLWAVIKVFSNIESSFNHIWEVRKSRSITRKISDYLSVLLVAPIFWLLSNNASQQIGDQIRSLTDGTLFQPVVTLISFILPFLVIWVMLAVVYFIMPNTKVKFGSAFRAAVVSGTALYLFQVFYFYSQSSLSSYNAIYGSFAALPLFLIWMHVSWEIIMFGGELSFGYQNIEKYEYEREYYRISYDYRRKATLLVMYRVACNFRDGLSAMDSDQLAETLNVPVRVVRDVLYDLEQAKLIVSFEDNTNKTIRYLPARDVSNMRVYDVIHEVENAGVQNFDIEQCEDLQSVNLVLADMDNAIKYSNENILLMDIEKIKYG